MASQELVCESGEEAKAVTHQVTFQDNDVSREKTADIEDKAAETNNPGLAKTSLKREPVSDVDTLLEGEEVPEKKKKISEESDGKQSFDPSKCRKKKVAVLLGYSGSGYFGMQKNPGVKTIEQDLVNALHLAGAIKEEVKDDMGKMSFQRAARTDKGVSAARQVVSLKMVPSVEIIPQINEHLPSGIRVFDIKRVTRSFDSKNQCCARTYEYLLPSFAFAPTYMETTSQYRIKDHVMANVTSFLKRYEGTHNFHNFTSGRMSTDPSSHRYIKSFIISKPYIRKGHEFLLLSVTGQSFILHQIRKMIGLCIAYCRGHCNLDALEKAWGRAKVDIPKAPGLGLVLDKVHYDAYNKRFGADGMHEPLSWMDKEDAIQDFKEKFIWSTIVDTEITQHSMMRWLSTLSNHTYDEEGIIRSLQRKASQENSLTGVSSDEEALTDAKGKTPTVCIKLEEPCSPEVDS